MESFAVQAFNGGGAGIRTQGAVTPASFQDWCNKPDSATPPYYKAAKIDKFDFKSNA